MANYDIGEILTGSPLPYGGAKRRWGKLKSATFDKYLAITRKR